MEVLDRLQKVLILGVDQAASGWMMSIVKAQKIPFKNAEQIPRGQTIVFMIRMQVLFVQVIYGGKVVICDHFCISD